MYIYIYLNETINHFTSTQFVMYYFRVMATQVKLMYLKCKNIHNKPIFQHIMFFYGILPPLKRLFSTLELAPNLRLNKLRCHAAG